MNHVVTLKVYNSSNGVDVFKEWYRVQNAKEVLAMNLNFGDTLVIKGIGTLKILDKNDQSNLGSEVRNPYIAQTLTCATTTMVYK